MYDLPFIAIAHGGRKGNLNKIHDNLQVVTYLLHFMAHSVSDTEMASLFTEFKVAFAANVSGNNTIRTNPKDLEEF